jgi:hypothetical protein
MSSSVVVALITGAAAMLVSLASFTMNIWLAGRARRAQTLDLVARYRDPLLWAAFDLRSRLFNIVAKDFLRVCREGDEDEWNYAQTSTLFVIAEYLGWVEILRRSVQFLDLGDDSRNRRLVSLFRSVDRAFSSVKLNDAALRLHRGEQRAIGELMLSSGRAQLDGPECIGYATFCARLEENERFASWFKRLRLSIEDLAARDVARTERLVDLQNRLMDLIDFLDPDAVRFPSRRRDRLFMEPPLHAPSGSSISP